jgi:hypothetical protein
MTAPPPTPRTNGHDLDVDRRRGSVVPFEDPDGQSVQGSSEQYGKRPSRPGEEKDLGLARLARRLADQYRHRSRDDSAPIGIEAAPPGHHDRSAIRVDIGA